MEPHRGCFGSVVKISDFLTSRYNTMHTDVSVELVASVFRVIIQKDKILKKKKLHRCENSEISYEKNI